MAVEKYVLSEESVKTLQRMLDDYRRIRKERAGITLPDEPLPSAPDVYVARTPGAGIPALRRDTDTGTGVLPIGTGSPSGQGHTPGSADCHIFKVVYTSTTPNLLPAGFDKTILNLSSASISGNSWILVERDKYGNWFAIPTAVAAAATVVFSGCRAYLDANLNPVTSGDKIIFNAERFDTDNYHSISTNRERFIPPTTGYYAVGGWVAWLQTGGTAGSFFRLRILSSGDVAGSFISEHWHTYQIGLGSAPSNFNIALTAHGICRVNSFDTPPTYFYMEVDHNVAAANITINSAEFWVHKLGDL